MFGQDLEMGGALRMGPGYFPKVLSGVIAVFGGGFCLSAFAVDGPEWEKAAWLPLAVVVGAVVLFAVMIKWAGLAATIVAVVLLSTLAAADRRWRESVPFALGLAFCCVVIFRLILSLHLPIWPQW